MDEANSTHPTDHSIKALDKDSLPNSLSTSGIYSITTRENIGAYHSQHGMYKQFSSRASQMSGSNIAESRDGCSTQRSVYAPILPLLSSQIKTKPKTQQGKNAQFIL